MHKVLIVDHHKVKRSWLAQILGEAGYETIAVEDAETGRRAVERGRPDAIVVTMTLPRVAGSEFALQIKDTPVGRRVPIILTSSLFKNMSLDRIAMKRWKVDAFLEEPFTPEQLTEALAEQIEAYSRLEAEPEESDRPAGKTRPAVNPFAASAAEDDFDPIDAALAAADLAAEEIEVFETERIERERGSLHAATPARAATPTLRTPTPVGPRRIDDLMIEPRGSLDDASVPEILAACFFAKITGLLIVSNRRVAKTVYLRDGCPISVTGEVRSETLGQLLLARGVIDESMLVRTLRAMDESGVRQGDALVAAGALTPTQLYQSLRMQAWEKMLGLFGWHSGQYLVVERPINDARITTFDMWPPLLILQGVLRHYDPADIREIFNELKDFVLRRRAAPPVDYDDLRFPAEVRALYDLVDGTRTVSEAVRESRFGPDKTFQVFYVLLILELFDKFDPAQTGDEAAPQLPETEVSFERLVEQAIAADLGPVFAGPDTAEATLDLADMLEPPPAPSFEFEPEGEISKLLSEETPFADDEELDLDILDDEDEEPAAKPAPATVGAKGDVFSLDEDEDELDIEIEERKPARPISIDELSRRTPRPGTDDAHAAADEEPLPISDALSKALDGFLDDTPSRSELSLGDETEFIRREDESGEEPIEIESAAIDEASAEAAMPEADRALLDEILRLYVSVDKATHYEILGIENNAADPQIREAYTRMVKSFHPDKLQDRFNAEVLEKANAVIKRATDAYRTVYDAKRRREYDKQLSEGTSPKKERSVAMILAAENEFSMGLAAMKQAAWDAAKRHFTKAVELFPEEAEYHACLGWSIYNFGDLGRADRIAQAKTLLEKAIALNARSDKAYFFMGMLLKDNDQFDKAAIMFAQAYRYNKNNNDAKIQLKALQALRARRPGGAMPPKSSTSTKDILSTDIKLDTVKKAILKIFW
ncbi:MAG: response regulator [Deltaproteobacteria bacterium]|nr:response regulator [Deltaproteobacteria bacterium]